MFGQKGTEQARQMLAERRGIAMQPEVGLQPGTILAQLVVQAGHLLQDLAGMTD